MNNNFYFHNHYSVIIGISEYQDDIKNLPYAANDAVRFYKALKKCGYSESRMHLLTHQPAEKSIIFNSPTRNNILNIFNRLVNEVQPNDLVIIYIACYGVDIFDRPYLLAQDTQLDYLLSTSIDLTEIMKLLKQSRAKVVLRLFDICRSHFAPGRQLISKMTYSFLNLLLEPVPGNATFCSCSHNEYAHESPEYKQGVFSYYFNNALEQGVGINDSTLSLDQIVDYVQNNVMEWTYKRKLKQNPVFNANLQETLVLSINSGKEKNTEILPYKYRFVDNAGLNLPQQTQVTDPEADTIPTTIQRPPQDVYSFYSKRSFMRKPPVPATNLSFEETHLRLLKSIDAFIKDFSHPYISIYRTEPVELKILSYFINQEFEKFLRNHDSGEQVKESLAVQIFFKNAESNAPVSSLYINFINFSNFYWLWYCLPFETLRMYGDFLPENPMKINYLALRPPGMLAPEMMSKIISDVFRDCTETIIDWTQQLHKYQLQTKK